MAAPHENEPSGSRQDWITDRALRLIIGSYLRLPYKMRVPLMGATLRRVIGPLVGYQKRAEENLARIYPDKSEAERRDIAKRCCDNFGRTLIENYGWKDFADHLASTTPTGDGLAALDQAKADGRPIIFVTGHFGNHEAPRQVLTRMGYQIGGLYRPMQNPFFNAHYAKTMTSWGGPVFAQGPKGTIGFARHLKSGGAGTLLFDVSAKGIAIPFLGHNAHTATSAADIALKLDAIVIPYFGIRQSDGINFQLRSKHRLKAASPEDMMRAMTARLENRIAQNPEQWFWVHRRWKKRKLKAAKPSK